MADVVAGHSGNGGRGWVRTSDPSLVSSFALNAVLTSAFSGFPGSVNASVTGSLPLLRKRPESLSAGSALPRVRNKARSSLSATLYGALCVVLVVLVAVAGLAMAVSGFITAPDPAEAAGVALGLTALTGQSLIVSLIARPKK